ncbi:MAG TPA: hypothetical protein VL086_19380 [Candidatus Nitrosotalea sp.]|nr:hypothetical protein [Candidatus Nitrosotalea sp.]
MKRVVKNRLTGSVALLALLTIAASASAADDTKAKDGAAQVESGTKQIGRGVEDTAKGIGKTVVGGAETAGDRIKEAGWAAEPEAKSAWTKTKEGAVAFGRSVRDFFTSLFQ